MLVTDITDPDWEPVMKVASAIVTNRGGRTCHAAIISRELGIPAVVGTGGCTEAIADGQEVTVCCSEGEVGEVLDGIIPYEKVVERTDTEAAGGGKKRRTKVSLILANPDQALSLASLSADGVGLVRLEFVIARAGVHPQAALDYPTLDPADPLRRQLADASLGYPSPRDFYVSRIAEGVGTIAAAFYPRPVVVRMSDFKSNEYASLLGGDKYESKEENPMLGFRGAHHNSSHLLCCRRCKCGELISGHLRSFPYPPGWQERAGTTTQSSPRRSSWSARRCAACARAWASRTWSCCCPSCAPWARRTR